jgi:AraC-like DNA-binding protein/ligand-binding sensor protein
MEKLGVFFDEKVQNLIDSFAYCFNVRITLFSSTMEVLFLGFHNKGCTYCQMIQQQLRSRYRCCRQDRIMCTRCERRHKPLVYQCYAGLMESVIPISLKDRVVGYGMLGQFRNQNAIPDEISRDWRKTGANSGDLEKAFIDQPYYEKQSVENMVNLFEMLCVFIVSNEYIRVRRPTVVENIVRWIENNISDPIALNEIADSLGYSRSTISHTVKQYLHVSFTELCILKKIERFESILTSNPAMSIQNAASSVGYDDPFYFSRLYKRIRLVNPSTFLKSIRDKQGNSSPQGVFLAGQPPE